MISNLNKQKASLRAPLIKARKYSYCLLVITLAFPLKFSSYFISFSIIICFL